MDTWFTRAKARVTRMLDIIEIILRAALYSFLCLIIPIFIVWMFVLMVLVNGPHATVGSPRYWVITVMSGITVLIYLTSVALYLHVHLVQRKTIPQYIAEHPRLHRVITAITEFLVSVAKGIGKLVDLIGELIAGVFKVGFILVILIVIGVVLYALFGAISAPWWAIVIIILLLAK